MELRHLRYFVAVAEEEHLGRAARRLHVSPPPLSRQIHELEEELGVALFARIGRGLQLTDTGRAFLARARAVLADVSQGVAEARSTAHGKGGRLSLGFTETVRYATMLPDIAAQFSRRHPHVAIQLLAMTSSEQRGALLEGRIDASFANEAPSDARLRSQRLLVEQMMVALPPRHRLAARRAVSLRDIEREPIVWPRRSDIPEMLQRVADGLRTRGLDANISVEARSAPMRLAMVAAGMGITIVPESNEAFVPDTVVLLPISDASARFESVLSWRAADQGSVALRTLREIAEAVTRTQVVRRGGANGR